MQSMKQTGEDPKNINNLVKNLNNCLLQIFVILAFSYFSYAVERGFNLETPCTESNMMNCGEKKRSQYHRWL